MSMTSRIQSLTRNFHVITECEGIWNFNLERSKGERLPVGTLSAHPDGFTSDDHPKKWTSTTDQQKEEENPFESIRLDRPSLPV